MSDPTSSPKPGWYPNSEGEGLRWWDGAAWTEHVQVEPVPSPEPTATPTPEPTATPTPEPTPASTPAPEPTPAPAPPASSPPPGVASTATSSVASTPAAAAGLPAADGGPTRIFGVRPAILIALLLVILAAFLLPKVIFDDEVEPVEPAPTPRGDPDVDEGRKSGGVEQDRGTTVLALEVEPGSYLIRTS